MTIAAAASCTTSTFRDPDLYRLAVRAVQSEVVVVGKGEFRGELTKIDFERLWMQRGHDTLARVVWAKNDPSRASISFFTSINQAPQTYDGLKVSPGDVVFASLGATYHTRTSGDSHWGAMSLTPEDLATTSRALIGREVPIPETSRLVHPAPALMSQLLDLHASAGQLARSAPEILGHPEVAHALEQRLLYAMVRCLADGSSVEGSGGNRRHAATLARLEELLMANCDRPLYLAEICTAIGVSERTLRLCCEEHLGIGPIQYLWLRRMNLAHRALVRATPATTSVTEIATANGFWELGRFAVSYRTLFGESPSVTLARAVVDRPTAKAEPFALASSRIQ